MSDRGCYSSMSYEEKGQFDLFSNEPVSDGELETIEEKPSLLDRLLKRKKVITKIKETPWWDKDKPLVLETRFPLDPSYAYPTRAFKPLIPPGTNFSGVREEAENDIAVRALRGPRVTANKAFYKEVKRLQKAPKQVIFNLPRGLTLSKEQKESLGNVLKSIVDNNVDPVLVDNLIKHLAKTKENA